MDVDVEVQGPSEPLHDGDGTSLSPEDAAAEGRASQTPEDVAHEHPHDRPAEIVVPRQEVPHAVWKGQDPLANRDARQHPVHQMARPLRHAARTTALAHGAALTRERHQAIHATADTTKAREAPRHPSTRLGMALSLAEGPVTRRPGTRRTPASAKATARLAGALRAKAARSTNRGKPSPARIAAACARNVSKWSRTTRKTTPDAASRGAYVRG